MVSSGIPLSFSPYRPSTGALSSLTTSIGYFGCSGSRSPTKRPYHATPALSFGLCAAYSQTIRPPQQKPVIPSLAVLALPDLLAQSTAALRSDITWASGTLETTLEISLISLIFETSPC